MKLALRLGAGALLLAALVWYADPAALGRQLRGIDVRLFGAAVLTGLASSLFSALRWSAIARRLGLEAPTPAMLILYARGMSANTLLPGAPVSGDVLRSVQLARLGNAAATSALSVFLDRASGLWMLCGLSLVSGVTVLLSGSGLMPLPEGYGYVAALAIAVAFPFVTHQFTRLGRQASRAVLATAGYSAGVQIAACSGLWLCGRAAGVELPYVVMIGAAAPIFAMAALPIGIAGFGGREAASVLILGALGVPGNAALATGLLYGVAAVVQGLLVSPAHTAALPQRKSR